MFSKITLSSVEENSLEQRQLGEHPSWILPGLLISGNLWGAM